MNNAKCGRISDWEAQEKAITFEYDFMKNNDRYGSLISCQYACQSLYLTKIIHNVLSTYEVLKKSSMHVL